MLVCQMAKATLSNSAAFSCGRQELPLQCFALCVSVYVACAEGLGAGVGGVPTSDEKCAEV